MTVFLQDRFIPEDQATVSIHDRSFRYGDGIFEAVLVHRGKMFRWPQHFTRLERSAQFLQLPLPYSADRLSDFANQLIDLNRMPEAVLRIQLSRGAGPRGYAPRGDEKPLVVMSMHPAPARGSRPGVAWRLIVSSFRVPANDQLTPHKTCNRLLQVVAAAEAREQRADETLLLNTDGLVTEGSTSNVLWVEKETVCTPPLGTGALPGVTRAAVLELCDALHIARTERKASAVDLTQSDGVFLSLTSRGIVEAESLDGMPLRRSPITLRLQREFEAMLERECA